MLAEKVDYIICDWRHGRKLYICILVFQKIVVEPSYSADVGINWYLHQLGLL